MSGAAERQAPYATYVFDCDGVILDSNRLKTEAFRLAAAPYGDAAAAALVDHHVANGGISRFSKFDHFLTEIVEPGVRGPNREALLHAYAEAVRDGLASCAVAPGLGALRERLRDARWMIVSGGSQDELRAVFAARGIAHYFDGGIFGSPDTKDAILTRECESGNIAAPALFIGDSKYDYRAADSAGLDFVFAPYWTEVEDWRGFVADNALATVPDLGAVADCRPR